MKYKKIVINYVEDMGGQEEMQTYPDNGEFHITIGKSHPNYKDVVALIDKFNEYSARVIFYDRPI